MGLFCLRLGIQSVIRRQEESRLACQHANFSSHLCNTTRRWQQCFFTFYRCFFIFFNIETKELLPHLTNYPDNKCAQLQFEFHCDFMIVKAAASFIFLLKQRRRTVEKGRNLPSAALTYTNLSSFTLLYRWVCLNHSQHH